MHESSRCPICGSELYIDRSSIFCSNPDCSYRGSKISIGYEKYMLSNPMKSLLPIAFIMIALSFILLTLSLIFTASIFILFIPFIFPMPFLSKFIRRRNLSKRSQRV